MFNNLIESTSHAGEFKRRGSFVLFTTATYVLLFIIAGVMSIYAYDARLEDQNTEYATMLSPVELLAAQTPVTRNAPLPRNNSNRPTPVVREIAMASVNNPRVVPDATSVTPNKNLPIPDGVPYTIGDHDSGPVEPGGSGRTGGTTGGSGDGGHTPVIEVGTPPPPTPAPAPKKTITSPRVLNSQALFLPKPPYPPMAKQMRIQGVVNVQVLIDESGRVISAKAVLGSPALINAAQQAAMQARFSPTMLGEQAVKVSGVITYNFVLQ
jgi:TonB family protein